MSKAGNTQKSSATEHGRLATGFRISHRSHSREPRFAVLTTPNGLVHTD